jgi:hypothetical protein
LGNFLKTWGERKNARAMFSESGSSSSSVNGKDPAGIALSLLRRVVAVGKMKKILNIEAGLDMIALGIAICSEVGVFKFIWNIHASFFLIRIMGCFRNW